MTRKEFINELESRLHRLPEEDRFEAIKYYEEYFDEAGIEYESDVIAELKSPAHIASKILSDYATNEAKHAKHWAGRGFRALWFMLLGIFAAPIAVPFSILLALIVIILTVVLIVAIIFLVSAGSILAIVAFFMLFVKPASAIMLIGIVLVATGVTKLIYAIVTCIIHGISSFVKKI